MILVRKVQMILISAKLAVLTKIAFAWSADNGRRPHFAKPEIGFFSIAGISKNLQLFAPNALACNASVFWGLKKKMLESMLRKQKTENRNCRKKNAGIDFFPNWYLTLSPKAMSNHNQICQHNGHIRQLLLWFVLLISFIQTVINDWLSFLWYVKCPSQGWTSWTFYPFAPQRTVRRILCALTYCLWHALRLFLYLQLCFVPH